jgi:hypothetical protein
MLFQSKQPDSAKAAVNATRVNEMRFVIGGFVFWLQAV